MEDKVYLSSADASLETYLGQSAFDRSLLLNLLFQPGVLVPDIFCFISIGLSKHLERRELSLFEAALQQGLVVPAFRSPAISSFESALEVVEGSGDPEQRIYGIHSQARRVASRLDQAMKFGKGCKPEYWPSVDLGERFQHVVEKYLQTSDPPPLPQGCSLQQEDLNALWEYTKRWRIACVQEAIEETRTVAGVGLRRCILLNVIGKDLGLADNAHSIENASGLLDDPRVDPTVKHALHHYVRWLIDCYQYNSATELGAMPDFPEYEPLSGVVANALLAAEPQPADEEQASHMRVVVPMPPIDSLLEMNPMVLVGIQNERGAAYRSALADWRMKRNSQTEQTLAEELRRYADEICQWAKRAEIRRTHYLEMLVDEVKGYMPPLGLLVTAGKGLRVIYRWHRQQPKHLGVEFGHDPSHMSSTEGLELTLLRRTDTG